MLFLIKVWQRYQLVKILAIVFLLAIVKLGFPARNWSWQKLPEIPNFPQIIKIRSQGLSLSGWKTLEQKTIEISQHKWSNQKIHRLNQPDISLLLRPQANLNEQPQLEWIDLNSYQQWQTDSFHHLPVTILTKSKTQKLIKIEVNFFRGLTKKQTFAVTQWYAWPEGGNTTPSDWFWVERMAQLSKHRAPWIAVCILIPIPPHAQIEKYWSQSESLSQAIQTTLITDIFAQP